MAKFKAVLITVIFLLVIGSSLWYIRASLSTKPVQRVESSASQGVSDPGVTIDDVWAKASYFDFSPDESVSPIGFVEELAESLDLSIDDPDELLTDVNRKQLLQSLAGLSITRTDPSPETYLQLASKEDSIYRWVTPGTDEWTSGGCRGALDCYFKGKQPSVNESPESMLRRLWEAKVIESGNRFVQVGVPPTGARIIIGMMRTP